MSIVNSLGSSNLGQLQGFLNDNIGIRQQLSLTQEQVSSGLIAQSYGGLGETARASLELTPQIAHEHTYQANIDVASGRLQATQGALSSIISIVSNVYAQTASLTGSSTNTPEILANLAKEGLQQVADLINTKIGEVYVFAGQDTSNPPLPDTSPATLVPALLASDTATAPFSTTLSPTPATVQVGEGQTVQIGLVANKNTLTVSTAPTTGSFIRDILREFATLTTITNGPTLQTTAADVRTRLSGAISAIASEAGSLGDIQANLENRKTQSAATVLTLKQQVSNAQDVDLAVTLSRLSALQTQLQSSYQLIASLRELSLSKYI